MFENEELKCKFSLPEPLRMRHVEQYETARDGARAAGAQFGPAINWCGALALIEDWECEALPIPEELTPEDLADVHGPILRLVMWVGGTVVGHVMGELFIPKN